jgi:DNA-binding GntR family transcriptional regulator
MAPEPDNSETPKVEQVINVLRDAIAHGEFPPGDLVSEDILIKALAKQEIEVSRMPVRQAITYFVAHGIMEVLNKRGTRMRITSRAEVKQIWDRRVALEKFVLTQLASQKDRDLELVEAAHRKMEGIVRGAIDLDEAPTDRERRDFVDWDEQFHQAICVAAGYPMLAEELKMLRLKLRFASNRERLLETKRRMKAIVQEHEDILQALRGGQKPGIRPDLNRVRLAFLVHMKYAGLNSWGIADAVTPEEGSGQASPTNFFKVPDLPPVEQAIEALRTPIIYPFLIRFATEMSAVWNLAIRSKKDIEMAELFQRRMIEKFDMAKKRGSVTSELEVEFVDLDINFHAALCFLGGVLFGDEVVTYAWHKIHAVRNIPLELNHMKLVIKQHNEILKAIQNSRGAKADAALACKAMETHLILSFIGHNCDQPMCAEAAEDLERLSRRMVELGDPQAK